MQPTQSPSPQATYIPPQSPPEQQQQQYLHLQPPQAPLHHPQHTSGTQPPPQTIYVQQQANFGLPGDGYVAAPASSFSTGPQSGPPHQGPPVLRGIQSAAPPTPPQQDLNKMQQPPPQQMYVQTAGANGTANVRQSQQMFRAASTNTANRGPRQSLAMASGPMYLPNASVVMPHASFHPQFAAAAARQQQGSYMHFATNSQMSGYQGYPYFIPNSIMATAGSHRGAANPMMGNATTGIQTPVGQGQIVPPCVLTPAPGGPTQHIGAGGGGQMPEKKKRQHALAIIDPVTKKNVLEEMDLQKAQSQNATSSSSSSAGGAGNDAEYTDQASSSSSSSSALQNAPEVSEINSAGTQEQMTHNVSGNGSIANNAVNSSRQVSSYSEETMSYSKTNQRSAVTTPATSSIVTTVNSDETAAAARSQKGTSDNISAYSQQAVADKVAVAPNTTIATTATDPRTNTESTTGKNTKSATNTSEYYQGESDVSFGDCKSLDAVSVQSQTSTESSSAVPYTPSSAASTADSAIQAEPDTKPSSVSLSSAASIDSGTASGSDSQKVTADPPVSSKGKTTHATDSCAPTNTVPSIAKGTQATATPASATGTKSTKDAAKKSGDHRDNKAASTTTGAAASQPSRPANQSGKMTLNDKETTTATTTTTSTKVVSSSDEYSSTAPLAAAAPEKKDTTKKQHSAGNSDNNDNIIQYPVKDSAATDVTSTNNNNQEPVKDDACKDPSLNNNNSVGVETRIAKDSAAPAPSAPAPKASSPEGGPSEKVPTRDSPLSDVNDNRLARAKSNDSQQNDVAPSPTDSHDTLTAAGTVSTSGDDADDASEGVATEDMSSASGDAPLIPPAVQSLIQYNKGQWSPFNTEGNKVYDRLQLMTLRDSPHSKNKPEVTSRTMAILRQNSQSNNMQQQPSLLPGFATNKRMPMGGGLPMRSGVSAGGSSSPGGPYNKQTSMSSVSGKSSSKGSKSGMIYLSLSLREDVKLTESENAWKPAHLRYEEAAPAEERDKDQLLRKVRGILNKLTPEKFEILVDQIMSLRIDTAEKIIGVMELVFEKAIDEPNFSVSYARLCRKLIESKLQSIRQDQSVSAEMEKETNLVIFRSALLDKTQIEFQENVLDRQAKEKQLRPIIERIKDTADLEKRMELQANLEEQERKIRRRSGGTVRFIGELFMINVLNLKVTASCIDRLLDPDNEDKLECLCKLLTTVGKKFEKDQDMEKTMKAMKQIVDRKKISSRVRFMLQDVIDLRKNRWESKRAEGPKTMEQIQKEAETEHMNSQILNYSVGSNKKDDRRFGSGGGSGAIGSGVGGGGGGGGGGMSSGGAGGNANFNKNSGDTWYLKTSKGNRAVDTNKLGHMINCGSENITKLGGSSQFQWNPGQGMGSSNTSSSSKSSFSTSNSFAVLSNLESNKGSNSGPRNKGSYSKSSMERDRHDRPRSRQGSTHGSRDNSSSRAGRGPNSARSGASHSYGSSSQPPLRSGGGGKMDMGRGDRDRVSTLERNRDRDRDRDREQQRDRERDREPQQQQQQQHRNEPEPMYPDDQDTTNRLIKELVTKVAEQYIEECPPIMRRYPEKSRWQFFFHIFCDYLHLCDTKLMHRKMLAKVFILLMKHKLITHDDFLQGYSEYSQIANEILIDVPEAWTAIFQFLTPLIHNQLVQPRQLWNDHIPQELGKKFIYSLIMYCTKEMGPNWTRQLWRNAEFKWSMFMPAKEVDQFVKENKFEFIENEKAAPVIASTDVQTIMDRVKELLADDVDKDGIIDYLNGNVSNIDKQFIRALTTTLCNFAIKFTNKNHKLDKKVFSDVCMPLLHRFIDSKEELELECLFAIQVLITRLEHPQGLLSELFVEMYEAEVIIQETFVKWRESKQEPHGKGVAVIGLTQFFHQMLTAETSDENN